MIPPGHGPGSLLLGSQDEKDDRKRMLKIESLDDLIKHVYLIEFIYEYYECTIGAA